MQFIDILILVIICFAAIRGFAQGLVRQIGSLGGLLLAIDLPKHYLLASLNCQIMYIIR